MGHVIQLRREGIKASAPMFIPFLGALRGDEGAAQGRRRRGARGPGRPGARLARRAWCRSALYALTGDELFQALAFVGFFLNLFNLLPVLPARRRPRDGGALPDDVARGLRAADRRHVRLPEPDHAPDPAVRRLRDLAPLEGAQGPRGAGVPPRVARGRGWRWRRSTSAWPCCWRWAWTRPSSSATSTTCEGGLWEPAQPARRARAPRWPQRARSASARSISRFWSLAFRSRRLSTWSLPRPGRSRPSRAGP